MGGEKGGGFFNLFDWNRKARKKLFSNGPISSEGIKQSKQSDENLSKRRLPLIDDEEIVGISSAKGSSNVSCASSVFDEEGNGSRAPGVVARLMGLDSLPTSGISDSHTGPLCDLISFQDNHSQKRGPASYTNDRFSRELGKHDPYSRKPIEMRSQKMPSSPIERFQTEQLPPRLARCVPIDYNKLLSPIKNPGFISGRNAADIMEAAAKILEPGAQNCAKIKVPSIVSCSTPLKLRESGMAPRTIRIPDSSRRLVESPAARSVRGQSLNRSWDGTEEITILRSSPETNQPGQSKVKSVSLAVQAKVNVQRRESSSVCSRNSLIRKDRNESKSSQPSNRKNKQHTRALASTSSGALRQNNQKQNCPTIKGKLALKPSTLEYKGRKGPSGESHCQKKKSVNKLSGNYEDCYDKEDVETTDLEKVGLTTGNKNFPRKKRMIERSFCHDKGGYIECKSVDIKEKSIKPKLVGDEQSRSSNNTDIVSFTFTSPVTKPMNGSQSLTQVLEKWEQKEGCSRESYSRTNAVDAKRKCLSSFRLDELSGDALSIILEQKLRELTSRAGSPYDSFEKASCARAPEPFKEESVSLTDTHSCITAEGDCISHESGIDKLDAVSASGLCARNKQVETMECSSSNGAQTCDSNYQHLSPLSTLEATFINESYNSSESWGAEGNKVHSSVQAHTTFDVNCLEETQSTETEMELSDSASSVRTRIGYGDHESRVHTKYQSQECRQEMVYVRQLLSNAGPMLKSLGLCQSLDPLLFDKLENKLSRTKRGPEDKDSRMERKVLFACVNECLDLSHNRNFCTGYRAWNKGVAVVQNDLAGQIYQEISTWRGMQNLMVDELVDRDMSGKLGSWVDFEIEAFEAGLGIEKEILNELVDELVADFLTKGSASCISPV